METSGLDLLFELLKYIVPMLFIGAFMWYLFKKYTDAEEKRQVRLEEKRTQSEASPIRFQAYERMTLLLERMSMHSLVSRVRPYNDSLADYARLLADHIEQEYEYNISQQVYISDTAWQMVREARKSMQSLINQVIKESAAKSIPEAQKALLEYDEAHVLPTEEAMDFIKNEIRKEF
ncbi:MAG: hypothetical protein PHD21_06280 [Flavobacteriales bacterium]|nr:hypothetical protein [Flavobacteriales bacterium]